MKYLLSVLLILGGVSGFAQEIADHSEILNFAKVTTVPVLEGCETMKKDGNDSLKTCFQRGIIQHVIKNFVYPKEALKAGVSARIFVAFIVERNGSISNIEVVKGAQGKYSGWFTSKQKKRAAAILDKEAMRVVSLVTVLKAARQDGKAVRMSFVLPINVKTE